MDSNNNNPDKSAFYKLTGTVAYDALTKNGEVIEYSSRRAAIKAYRNAVKGTTLTDEEILGTYVVPLAPAVEPAIRSIARPLS